jgi:glycosyltransferase involved in cell wall biosynthesis
VPDPTLTALSPEGTPGRKTELHVRLVTWDDDPPVGGQGVYARELRAALGRRGVVVSTAAGRGPHALGYRRITGRGHLDMSIRLNADPRLLFDEETDLVHVSGGPGGLQLLRRLPVPVVFTAHHTYRQAHGRLRLQRALSALEAASYRRAAAVAAVSDATAQAVLDLGVPPERVHVIPPGVQLSDAATPVEREPGRMLFVGRLEPEKGPIDAIDAMQRVMEDVPAARGVIVGAGSLESVVRDRTSGTDRISLRSHLSDDELAAEYRRAQVVLMPSRFEGLGIVALEAMAAGAVVVGYDAIGLRDTIGRDGVLVPAGDVAELVAASRRLLEDDARRVDIAGRAAIAVRERYSWDRCAARFEELYRPILARV